MSMSEICSPIMNDDSIDVDSSAQHTPRKRDRKRKSYDDEEPFDLPKKKEVKKKPKRKTSSAKHIEVTAVEVIPLPPPDIPILDIPQAIYKALDEIIDVTSLLDYTHLLGSLCKVYWDGENQWFYARILAYDSASNLHFVYYLEDNTCEWLNFDTQGVLLSKNLVLIAMKGSANWPGMHFSSNGVADRVLSSTPGYKKGLQYVEFFNEPGVAREYGFYGNRNLIHYTNDMKPPTAKHTSKRLLAAYDAICAEMKEIELMKEQILSASKQKLLFARRGNHALGLRVQASSYVLPSEKTSVATRKHEYSEYSGTVRHYSPGIDQYMVVFDDAIIAPQWTRLEDVILLQEFASDESITVDSCDSGAVVCGLCGQRHESSDSKCFRETICDPHLQQCIQCKGSYHTYCMPEGLVAEVIRTDFRCWKCICCLGCSRSAFESPVVSTTLRSLLSNSIYPDTPTLLCSKCSDQYTTTLNYCPICYKLYEEEKSIVPSPVPEVEVVSDKKGKVRKGKNQRNADDVSPSVPSEVLCAPCQVMRDTAPEQSTEQHLDDEDAQMVQCSECFRWVHALCEGIDSQQYIAISNGTHPVWGDEYLCPLCRLTICKSVLSTLGNIDKEQLFAEPVSELIAKNYYEIIKTPMDLKTMRGKAQKGTYKSLQALRQDFELMCLNAAVFNKVGDYYFNYTRDYFNKAATIFDRLTHRTNISANGVEFNEIVHKRLGKKRKSAPSAAVEESPALSTVAEVASVNMSNESPPEGPMLPTSLSMSPFEYSCLPVFFSHQSADVALFTCLNEACVCCGSGGNSACLLFCSDCGECYHYYCVDAPIRSMSVAARQMWRCMNCSLCCACHNATSRTSLIYCESCDRAFHMNCLTPPLTCVPSTSFVCNHCVNCVTCASDELTGKKFFRTLTNFWGCSSTSCIRCEIALNLKGMSNIPIRTFIKLPTNCNVCTKKCVAVDDAACWRSCRLCLSPVHDACDVRYNMDVMQDDFYYVCFRCSRHRVITDIPTHLGQSEKSWQVLQKVSLIQQHRMTVKSRQLEEASDHFVKSHLTETEYRVQWSLYESVIIWACHRFRQLEHNSLLHNHIKMLDSTDFSGYPYLYHRASRFVRLLKKENFPWHRSLLKDILSHNEMLKYCRAHHSISRLAMMAAAFLAITGDELMRSIPKELQAKVLPPTVELVNSLVILLRRRTGGVSIDGAVTDAEKVDVLQKIKRVCDYLRSPPLGVRTDSSRDLPADTSDREQVRCLLNRVITAVVVDCKNSQSKESTTEQAYSFRFPLVTRPLSASQVDEQKSLEGAAAVSRKRTNKRRKHTRKKAYATLDDGGGMLQTINRENGTPTASAAPSACGDNSSVSSSKTKRRRVDNSPKVILRIVEDDKAEHFPGLDAALNVGHSGHGFSLCNVPTNEGEYVMMWTKDAKSSSRTSDATNEQSDVIDSENDFNLNSEDNIDPLSLTKLCDYRDPRYCVFCKSPEADCNDSACIRLLPFPDGSYAHVNCVRCSSRVVECEGALEGATFARTKSAAIYCSLCGEVGAYMGCVYKACKKTFHSACAAAFGCISVNLMDKLSTSGERYWATACPLHIDELESKQWLPPLSHDTGKDVLKSLCIGETDEESTYAHHSECAMKLREGSSVRLGALTILQLGSLRVDSPNFHDEHCVYPVGFRSMRIFWSMVRPYARTLYSFEVLETSSESEGVVMDPLKTQPVFRVVAGDSPSNVIVSSSLDDLFDKIVSGVRECNNLNGQSVLLNRIITTSMRSAPSAAVSNYGRSTNSSTTSSKTVVAYGLNPYQFFGVGSGVVRQAIEQIPDSVVCMTASFYFNKNVSDGETAMVQYKPSFVLPKKAAVFEIFRKQAQLRNIRKRHLSGCARAEGRDVTESNAFTSRITNLAKAVDNDDESDEEDLTGDVSDAENTDLSRQQEKNNRFKNYIETCYKELAEGYHENPYAHLAVRRSQIHGWGLYATTPIPSDTMIVEYLGEKIRQVVADQRESMYEYEGVGSCYMFRLDKDNIIDATRKGGIARFMNHCCQPNAYARIISTTIADDTDTKNLRMSTLQTAMCAEMQGRPTTTAATTAEEDEASPLIDKRLLQSSMIEESKTRIDKHIVIMAARDIKIGEEITYDYKFPIEDVKLVCYCGAPGCSGSMN